MARGFTLVRLVVSVLCGLVVDDKDQLIEALEEIGTALELIKQALIDHDARLYLLENPE